MNIYKNYIKANKSKRTTSSSIAFTKSMNADLFYALHNVRIKTSSKLDGKKVTWCHVTLEDTFDFAVDNNYNDLFSTIVNNWAWLCQQTHVLHKIPVTITFNG